MARVLQRDLGDGCAVISASLRVLAHAAGDANVRLVAGETITRQTLYFVDSAEWCGVLGSSPSVTGHSLHRLALPLHEVLYAIATDVSADPYSRDQMLALLRALPAPVTVL